MVLHLYKLNFYIFKDYAEFYDQTSSQSSGGGFSINGATPSPSPLTPTPTPTHMLVNSFERLQPSPPQSREPNSNQISQFQYLNSGVCNNQTSPLKFIHLHEDLALELGSGISPLKGTDMNRHYIQTRTYYNVLN